MLLEKWDQHYSTTLGWLWISLSLRYLTHPINAYKELDVLATVLPVLKLTSFSLNTVGVLTLIKF